METQEMAEDVKKKVKKAADKISDKVSSAAESMNMPEDETGDHMEGPVARAIEYQTARLPSDVFLWSALGSIGVAAYFQFRRRHDIATFIGQWAPTLLVLGLYNKLVKVAGSDRLEQNRPFFGDGRKGERALH